MYFRQIYGTAEQLTEKGFFVGVIKRASQAFRRARVLSELQFLTGDMQKAFFKVLRCASHWPAAQGKGSLFLHPALTPLPGLVSRWFEYHGADFHLLGFGCRANRMSAQAPSGRAFGSHFNYTLFHVRHGPARG